MTGGGGPSAGETDPGQRVLGPGGAGLVDHVGGAVGDLHVVGGGPGGHVLLDHALAAAGPVPFVAMAAPQPARRVTRAAGPNALPAAWTGALLVTAADLTTQRLACSALLPVGVLTGVAGGVCPAWLLRGERRGARL